MCQNKTKILTWPAPNNILNSSKYIILLYRQKINDNFTREKVFKDQFEKKYGQIQLYSPYTYDAVTIMAAAMKKADSTEPAKYLPELAKISYDGKSLSITPPPFSYGQLTDTRAGIVIAQTFVAAPFLIIAARGAFAAVDPAFEDVARTLGHRGLSRFRHVPAVFGDEQQAAFLKTEEVAQGGGHGAEKGRRGDKQTRRHGDTETRRQVIRPVRRPGAVAGV